MMEKNKQDGGRFFVKGATWPAHKEEWIEYHEYWKKNEHKYWGKTEEDDKDESDYVCARKRGQFLDDNSYDMHTEYILKKLDHEFASPEEIELREEQNELRAKLEKKWSDINDMEFKTII